MTTIRPTEKFCDYIDNVMTIGFKESDYYLIIQRSDQDAANLYIELNGQEHSCYNGIKEIIIDEDKMTVRLNSTGQEILNTDAIQIVDKVRGNPAYSNFIKEIEIINRSIENNSAQR